MDVAADFLLCEERALEERSVMEAPQFDLLLFIPVLDLLTRCHC